MIRDKLRDGTIRLAGGKKLSAWPVGSIYLSINSTDPATYLGGTWQRYAKGRMPVSVDEAQQEFNFGGKTGGEKTHSLVEAEMPNHAHDITHQHDLVWSSLAGGHSHTVNRKDGAGSSTGVARGAATGVDDYGTSSVPSHEHLIDVPIHYGDSGPSGSGSPHNNLPPYIAVYMWRRIA